MTTGPFRMARPGYTLRVGTPAVKAVAAIEQVLTARGFSRRTRQDALPAEFYHGSLFASFLADETPLGVVPFIWKKTKRMTARVRLLESADGECTLRIDARFHESKWRAFPYFAESVAAVADALGAQGAAVEIASLTDSALEGRS